MGFVSLYTTATILSVEIKMTKQLTLTVCARTPLPNFRGLTQQISLESASTAIKPNINAGT